MSHEYGYTYENWLCLHDRQVLQIDPDATDDELKKRFRAVSKDNNNHNHNNKNTKRLSLFYMNACLLLH